MTVSKERIKNIVAEMNRLKSWNPAECFVEDMLAIDDAFRKAHAEETEGEPELPEGIRHIAGEYMLASGDVFITEEWSSDEIAAIARHMRYMEKQRAKPVVTVTDVSDSMAVAFAQEYHSNPMSSESMERYKRALRAALAAKGQ